MMVDACSLKAEMLLTASAAAALLSLELFSMTLRSPLSMPGVRTTLVDQVAEGRFSDGVPVLLGSNLDEGTIFMELSPPLPCANASNASFAAWAEAMFGVETAAAVVAAYQKLRAPLPHWQHK